MRLEPGTRIGPYEILDPLGAGGMGEVYRARDTKLSREVAIKVLPAFASLDRDQSARFRREALALAALNHPHVATVYGLEDADQDLAIAMELVEGPTLAERLASGALAVSEALPLARQIAEGLEAAHARGIIHRDLKPQNIKLTSGGRVKLLDFGLAKLNEPLAGPNADAADLPTITGAGVTSLGTILGTAAYMAPEQARGQAVDHRADIWAFGSVLFEMLSGRRPFAGNTTTDVLAAILQSEPDWSALPSTTPAQVRRLLRRCLQKPLDRRLHSARDAILDIDDALSPAAEDDIRVARGRPWSTLLPWLIAAASIVALILSLSRSRTQPPAGPSKLTIALPYPLGDSGRPVVALSPDGSQIAFVAQHDDRTNVYVRRIDGFESNLLAGTQGATSLAYSPDGEWIVFHSGTRLRKVSVRGGPPLALAEMPDFMGASWSGSSIVASSAQADLLSVPADGGDAKSLLTAAEAKGGAVQRLLPHMLPGGDALLFSLTRPQEMLGSVAVRVVKTGEERVLVRDATQASYFDGWLAFARSGTLFAVRFDLQRLAIAGTPVPVLQGVKFNQSFGTTHYSVAKNGTLAYVAGADAERPLAMVDRNETMSVPNDLRRASYLPRISPDGRRLALTILEDGAYSIWLTGSLDGPPSRFAEQSFDPVWSPDGKSIAFTTLRDGGLNLAVARVDEGVPPKTIFSDNAAKVPTSWTPDGKSVLFTRVDPDGATGEDVYIIGADGASARPLVQTADNETAAAVSPDGKWLAFSRGGVLIAPLSDPARQSRVGVESASMPVWSRDGRELFFLSGPRTASVSSS